MINNIKLSFSSELSIINGQVLWDQRMQFKKKRQIVVLACYFFLTHTLAVEVRIIHRASRYRTAFAIINHCFSNWILSSIYECYKIFISVCFCQIVSKSLNGILTFKKKTIKKIRWGKIINLLCTNTITYIKYQVFDT